MRMQQFFKVGIFCLVISLFALQTAVADHVYKWVDDKGEVHYQAEKPRDAPCEEIAIPKPPEVDKARQQERWQKQQKLLQEFDAAQREKKAKHEREQAIREVNKQYCEDAKRHLRFFSQARGGRLARPDEQGNMHWVSDKERQALIEHWQKQVKEFCE